MLAKLIHSALTTIVSSSREKGENPEQSSAACLAQIAGRGLSSVIGVANEVLLRPIKAIHTWLWAQVAKIVPPSLALDVAREAKSLLANARMVEAVAELALLIANHVLMRFYGGVKATVLELAKRVGMAPDGLEFAAALMLYVHRAVVTLLYVCLIGVTVGLIRAQNATDNLIDRLSQA